MERIVDIASDGRHLSAHRGFLVVSEGRAEVGRVPLDDVAAVVVHAHGVTWSVNLVTALAERGAPLVFCGPNHAPVAVCLPLEGHHGQNARMRAQWEAGRPLSKQLWREIVSAKIRWQGAALAASGGEAGAFETLARRVRSGDPENLEAQAARRYWPALMGADFRRDRSLPGANALLNYGYTVMRALLARSLVASGLHPSIGVHHANRGDAFALADDMVEPFRPLVDLAACALLARGAAEVTPAAKRLFAGLTALDLPGEAGVTTVAMAAQRMAQSLARAFETGRAGELAPPRPPSPLELSGFVAAVAIDDAEPPDEPPP
ncbi:MAG: type II CRISPR-associated endonuclease Cas1 [Ancylobacter novellus]|uniref:CRISPR-associated endonuclease Cas1 n=1 Tax=Ancylobacter novellus TaxID=921 RepID=A0A2W5K778_ANCNO|nr:MAG: type II CRISPR-associated endonuclease Cas1 [Ancylobacter novellus]